MANHTSHSHIQQFPNHLTTQTKTTNTHKIAKPPQPKTQKTTQNGETLHSVHHAYEKLPTYSSTQTSKSASDAATQFHHSPSQPPTTSSYPHNIWGVYLLTCKTCNLWHVGQTSRNLKIRFQEQIRYIKTNSPQSAYAQHILHNRHEYGRLTFSRLMTYMYVVPHR